MRGRRLSALSAGVLATALLGGCTADGAEAGQADGGATGSTTSPARPTQEAVLQDATVCAAFNDVLTIVENADLAVRDGRMAGQEQQGWYRLATRVLDRLPSPLCHGRRGNAMGAEAFGTITDDVAEVKDHAPRI